MTEDQDSSSSTTVSDPVAGKTVAEILGEIAWLMTQDPNHAESEIRSLETHVMPGIVLRQFHIQYAEMPSLPASGNVKPNLQPVSVDVWAMINSTVAARLDANPGASLSVADWRSGTIRRVMLHSSILQRFASNKS